MINLQNRQKKGNSKGDDELKRCRELYETLSEDRDTQEFLKKIPESLRKLEIPVMFEKGTTVILKMTKRLMRILFSPARCGCRRSFWTAMNTAFPIWIITR